MSARLTCSAVPQPVVRPALKRVPASRDAALPEPVAAGNSPSYQASSPQNFLAAPSTPTPPVPRADATAAAPAAAVPVEPPPAPGQGASKASNRRREKLAQAASQQDAKVADVPQPAAVALPAPASEGAKPAAGATRSAQQAPGSPVAQAAEVTQVPAQAAVSIQRAPQISQPTDARALERPPTSPAAVRGAEAQFATPAAAPRLASRTSEANRLPTFRHEPTQPSSATRPTGGAPGFPPLQVPRGPTNLRPNQASRGRESRANSLPVANAPAVAGPAPRRATALPLLPALSRPAPVPPGQLRRLRREAWVNDLVRAFEALDQAAVGRARQAYAFVYGPASPEEAPAPVRTPPETDDVDPDDWCVVSQAPGTRSRRLE